MKFSTSIKRPANWALVAAMVAVVTIIGCGGSGSTFSSKLVTATTGTNTGTTSSTGTTTTTGGPVGILSEAYAINDNGTVVGYSQLPRTGKVAVLWDNGEISAPTQYTVTDIGNLGGRITIALAMSSTGKVTGYGYTAAQFQFDGFMWDGTMHDFGPNSRGLGINAAGDVVAAKYNLESGIYAVGYLVRHDTTQLVQLNDPTFESPLYQASAITTNGTMYGYYETDIGNPAIPFTIDPSLNPTNFANPTFNGIVTAANDENYIIGTPGIGSNLTGPWWSLAGSNVAHSLPTHSVGACQAYAINNNNVIVGTDTIGGALHGVEYTLAGAETDLGVINGAGSTAIDLNTLISTADQQTYGTLTDARGINGSFQICCNTSSGHAVVLTPVSQETSLRPSQKTSKH